MKHKYCTKIFQHKHEDCDGLATVFTRPFKSLEDQHVAYVDIVKYQRRSSFAKKYPIVAFVKWIFKNLMQISGCYAS